MAKARKKRAPETHLVSVKHENPNWSRDHDGAIANPKYIQTLVNPRESAITALAARNAIDEAQNKAAERFRAAYEMLGGAGAKAIDYSREPVDGGRYSDPISLRHLQAQRDLSSAQKALKEAHGEYSYRLVLYVAGEGHSIHDLTETRRQRDTMTDNLRAYLDVLAILWGYSNKGSLRHRNDLTRARGNGISG